MERINILGFCSLLFCLGVDGSPETCSYTFIVPSESAANVWPTTVTDSRMRSLEDTVANQQSLINYQQSQLQLQADRIASLENNSPGNNVEGSSSVGTTYVRWGRTICPSTSEIIYKGYAGKAYYDYGGGVNYQCLPEDPEWPAGATGGFQSQSRMYGVEYERRNSPLIPTDAQDREAPCVVCNVSGRSRVLMIPAKKTCPAGWTKEYSGLLVAQKNDEKGSTFECLDAEFEYDTAGYQDQNSGSFYVVEASCGSLPCPPYVSGNELSCVVCTL